jgi:hydrogenase maturation factor HypF (carbamoyltransferase family)
MKGAIALGWGRRAVISPHIGVLDSPRSFDVFDQTITDLQALYRVEARRMVCDAHPNYASARWAVGQGLPVTRVQHHVAHASHWPENVLKLDDGWSSPGTALASAATAVCGVAKRWPARRVLGGASPAHAHSQ